MSLQAQNTFTDGLTTDFHPLNCKNSILTDALNATLVTTKGNEMVLQNDIGNSKIVTDNSDGTQNVVKLKDGFIPLGAKEYQGIIYIASYNPLSKQCEIGTYPSPDYDSFIKSQSSASSKKTSAEIKLPMLEKYQPLRNLVSVKDDTLYDKGLYISSKVGSQQNVFDLNTELLNFDINHPVNIEIQASYDGSVNLLLNDGINIPRLINSRFSTLENGYAKIPERRRNDDNLYSKESKTIFDIDTSLIKRINSFPRIEYSGILYSGSLKVGNYTFYIKYCDSDGNETDWVAESGIISIFKGLDQDPFSIDGGVEDMNANKSIKLVIKDIDTAYHYVKVYFVRNSAAKNQSAVQKVYEITEPFEIQNSKDCTITITGEETTVDNDISEIQASYQIIDSAKTQAQCQNMLFQANVSESEIYYKDLTDLSLRIIPSVTRMNSETQIGKIESKDYSSKTVDTSIRKVNYFPSEYYNTKNIYYNVGYWNEEFYRIGIVYIYDDNSLSNVFNIVGGELNFNSNKSNKQSAYDEDSIFGLSDNFTIENITDTSGNRQYYNMDDNYITGFNSTKYTENTFN